MPEGPEENSNAPGEEVKLEPLEHGFDKEGYLRIKIHLSMGKWNILGALAEAQLLVVNFFGQMAEAQEAKKKQLIRPNSVLERFKNKWH